MLAIPRFPPPVPVPLSDPRLFSCTLFRALGCGNGFGRKYVRRTRFPTGPDPRLSVTPVVLAVRTYAVWNKDKRVGIGLALLLGLCQIPNGIIIEKFMQEIDRECRLGFCRDPPRNN